MFTRENTIAAIATAGGAAAIGIIRISGPDSGRIIREVVPGAKAWSKPRRVVSGEAIDPTTGEAIDEVLCFHCKAPKTATGEDTAEIQGHGGPLIMQKLLHAVLGAGAVIAEPGEFTYRAYRNGRFDLTQAEAVMGLIGAKSDRACKIALNQLDGALGRSLENEFNQLIELSAEVEAGLDFPDEDLDLEQSTKIVTGLTKIRTRLSSLEDSYTLGSRLKDGARVAIVGPPNAGKSSLLNALSGEDRALVDPDPGTTRDVVEAKGEAGGIPLVFLDTAGLRRSAGRVEQRGIEKTIKTTESADVVIVVVDGSVPLDEYRDDLKVPSSSPIVIAVNKMDLPNWSDPAELSEEFGDRERIPTSAVTGKGLDILSQSLAEILSSNSNEDTQILTTARQHEKVSSCTEYIEKATKILEAGQEPELAAADLRVARDALAELWGRDATDDMLGAIFERFCLGK